MGCSHFRARVFIRSRSLYRQQGAENEGPAVGIFANWVSGMSAGRKNPFAHYPTLATNISLVDILCRVGFDVSIDGAGAERCGAAYGSIAWLLEDTDSNSSPANCRERSFAPCGGIERP